MSNNELILSSNKPNTEKSATKSHINVTPVEHLQAEKLIRDFYSGELNKKETYKQLHSLVKSLKKSEEINSLMQKIEDVIKEEQENLAWAKRTKQFAHKQINNLLK